MKELEQVKMNFNFNLRHPFHPSAFQEKTHDAQQISKINFYTWGRTRPSTNAKSIRMCICGPSRIKDFINCGSKKTDPPLDPKRKFSKLLTSAW